MVLLLYVRFVKLFFATTRKYTYLCSAEPKDGWAKEVFDVVEKTKSDVCN